MVIHPLLLHFPIALLLTGTVTLLVSLFRPGLLSKSSLSRIAFDGFVSGTLGLGYAGLVLTVITGLFDMQASPKTLARDGWIVVAVLHIIAAVSLLVCYGFLLYRRFVSLPPPDYNLPASPPPSELPAATGNLQTEVAAPAPVTTKLDWLSIALALLGLLLLVIAGWLGGTLVYEYRVGMSG
jgi:uncharacterized membrane protein